MGSNKGNNSRNRRNRRRRSKRTRCRRYDDSLYYNKLYESKIDNNDTIFLDDAHLKLNDKTSGMSAVSACKVKFDAREVIKKRHPRISRYNDDDDDHHDDHHDDDTDDNDDEDNGDDTDDDDDGDDEDEDDDIVTNDRKLPRRNAYRNNYYMSNYNKNESTITFRPYKYGVRMAAMDLEELVNPKYTTTRHTSRSENRSLFRAPRSPTPFNHDYVTKKIPRAKTTCSELARPSTSRANKVVGNGEETTGDDSKYSVDRQYPVKQISSGSMWNLNKTAVPHTGECRAGYTVSVSNLESSGTSEDLNNSVDRQYPVKQISSGSMWNLNKTAVPHTSECRVGYTVSVSNLEPSVTSEDLNELFSDMGYLLECKKIRTGIAVVTFQNREDATRAIDYYDKRKLDGKPMHCDMLPNYRASETAVRTIFSHIDGM